MNITELRKKVELGIACHSSRDTPCNGCPYRDVNYCGVEVMKDALKIADHYKAKYESTLISQPTMILHDPAPIRIEPVDVKATLKAIKAMERMENAARAATEAMYEAKSAVIALKEELKDEKDVD